MQLPKITMRNKGNKAKDIEVAWKEFVRHNIAKNLSEDTLIGYEECYKAFTKFYKGKLMDIDSMVIDDYIYHLKMNSNMRPTSINTRLRGIRVFLNFCMNLGYLPQFKISLIKEDREIKEIYTDEELQLLTEKPDLNKCNFATYRTYTIICFALGTGCRYKTIVNLRIKDIDFESGNILLTRTKNRNSQVIPLDSTLAGILREYLTFREGEEEDYLFVSNDNNKLTRSAFNNALKRYNLRRGVTKYSIHLFRNTFAKNYLISGGDLFRLQKILGHSTLDMVKLYAEMYTADLQKNYDQYSPLSRIHNEKKKISMNR